MIGGIRNGKRMDINFRPGQFFTHACERAGPVAEEHCQLRNGFDLDRRLISHISTRCRSSSVLTIKSVSPSPEAFLPATASGNACPTRVSVGSSFLKSPKPGIRKGVARTIGRPLWRIHFAMRTHDCVMCLNFPAAFSQIINQLFAGL